MKRPACLLAAVLPLLWCASAVRGHDWHPEGESTPGSTAVFQPVDDATPLAVLGTGSRAAGRAKLQYPTAGEGGARSAPEAVMRFAESFVQFRPHVRFRWDADYFYVESDGIPGHGMMEGITAWQQQIPLPTYYFGPNAWRLPLFPVPAATPYLVTSTTFNRGAIAIAANGIPIFNPYNNRGEASALIGELDKWGGHCGRADDYHYHVAPLHLTNTLGIARPVAFALDGYPVYGLTEPDGSVVSGLDALHGHTNVLGRYHYHASLTLPYLNAGFHGTVVYANGQVEPQPSVRPIRPSGTPLNGATLVEFSSPAPDQFSLRYRVGAGTTDYYWNYSLNRAARSVAVTYIGAGGTTQANYPDWQPAPATAASTVGILQHPGMGAQLQLGGEPGRGYALECSADLVHWVELDFLQLDNSGAATAPLPTTNDRNFFRTH